MRFYHVTQMFLIILSINICNIIIIAIYFLNFRYIKTDMSHKKDMTLKDIVTLSSDMNTTLEIVKMLIS